MRTIPRFRYSPGRNPLRSGRAGTLAIALSRPVRQTTCLSCKRLAERLRACERARQRLPSSPAKQGRHRRDRSRVRRRAGGAVAALSWSAPSALLTLADATVLALLRLLWLNPLPDALMLAESSRSCSWRSSRLRPWLPRPSVESRRILPASLLMRATSAFTATFAILSLGVPLVTSGGRRPSWACSRAKPIGARNQRVCDHRSVIDSASVPPASVIRSPAANSPGVQVHGSTQIPRGSCS